MLPMVVTLEVSKLSGWLNADAPRNISYMVVTLEVFQLDMSALKVFLLAKSELISVTFETSQLAMSERSSSLSAAARSALFANTLAGGEGEGGGGEGEGGGGDGERS